ncbi:MAG TPA: 50S ribosomal protein L15 [Candidatus Cybelea sp.]|nr:50S ribosomal protein L15 [Candidatus Cybelea sp.]
MRLNQLSDNPGSRKSRMRIGRGIGSGKGKTGGRGGKGQKGRTGVRIKGFEGGQMPLHRRLPKRGFKNPFREPREVVNLGKIQAAIDAGRIDVKAPVTVEALKAAGLVRGQHPVRLLGEGEIKVAVTIDVAGASKPAVEAVEKAGGKVIVPIVEAAPEEPKKKERKPKAKKAETEE